MAFQEKQVKQLQALTSDLGELIKDTIPVTTEEWDAFYKMVSAHKNLTKIDTGALMQLPLPLKDAKAEAPKEEALEPVEAE